jgi:hypothetical protein
MAGERNYRDPEDSNPGSERGWGALAWGLMIAVGLLVWELTDRSELAASVACLKFGWEETAAAGIAFGCKPSSGRLL